MEVAGHTQLNRKMNIEVREKLKMATLINSSIYMYMNVFKDESLIFL
jgi:hypothetical protein